GTYNVDRAMDACFADDGGVFTDETTACNNDTANDITLLPATPVVNDAYYFGYDYQTRKVTVNVGTVGTGTYEIDWEYWNGAWTDITPTDGTNGFTTAGENDITYALPSDWVKTTINSTEKYYIRARLDVITLITQPLGTQAYGFGQIHSPSDNVELSGVGKSTIIQLANSYNANINILYDLGHSGIVISNLTVDGNQANQASGNIYPINLSSTTINSIVKNCWITGTSNGTFGVIIRNKSITSNCYFYGNHSNSTGLWISGNDNIVTENIFTGPMAAGIYEQNSNNNTITGNSFYSASVNLWNSTNNSIVGNKFSAGRIYLRSGSNNNTITGNSIYNSSSEGINIENSSYNTISSNTLKNNTTAEIYITNTSLYNTIDGNNIQTDIAYGIQEAASADDHNIITNNTVIGATTSAISVLGANTTVSGNKTDTAGEGLHQISTSTNATSNALTVTQNGTGDIINLYDGPTEAFTILDGGNVGIGNASPSYKLDVDGV
ncbi:MAG: right-handed parallel beta-helix repeat-containing protein, partial [Candidatus Pacebacteria bacterium]|nr:right-handed parallel beta-helix repeat-containing protein [Candidatus Paceibacterota bacterium]